MIKVFENARIAEHVEIGEFSVIGKRSRPAMKTVARKNRELEALSLEETIISWGCYIGAQVLIEEGVRVGSNCIIESKCTIEKGTTVGDNCFIVQGARILQSVSISTNCVIGGFIADRSIIGKGCRVLGDLLHKQNDPHLPWDENTEPAPILGDYVFVGVGAKILGNVRISNNVYVCSGAIITKRHSITKRGERA